MTKTFEEKLKSKIRAQVNSARVGFLLGAGSSHLDGEGYPLAGELWDCISDKVSEKKRNDIQDKLNQESIGLEAALDALEDEKRDSSSYRTEVISAIAKHFFAVDPPLGTHRRFLKSLVRHNKQQVHIFSLNYDPLIERAAELEKIRLFDCFHGHEQAFFDPESLQYIISTLKSGGIGFRERQVKTWIRLIKLHGSLGWYENSDHSIYRTHYNAINHDSLKYLMIPPQYLKAQATASHPYSILWEEFRARLIHGSPLLNRLVVIGYGMADEHINAVIEQACARDNFTLIIITKVITQSVFNQWSGKKNVIIITEDKSALYGQTGEGVANLSSFEGFLEELNQCLI